MKQLKRHLAWSPALHHEISTEDTYRLRQLNFAPRVVYDIGANLGCFAAFSKILWPNCQVVCVEPNPHNFTRLEDVLAPHKGIQSIHAAMATGPAHWIEAPGGNTNPGGHTYVSETVGYEAESLAAFPLAECPSLSLAEIAHAPIDPYIVKIDCEGGEQCLFDDDQSNLVLRGAAYWTAELHFFAAKHRRIPEADKLAPGLMGTHGHVIRKCLDWIYEFSDTHIVDFQLTQPNAGMVWCTRK